MFSELNLELASGGRSAASPAASSGQRPLSFRSLSPPEKVFEFFTKQGEELLCNFPVFGIIMVVRPHGTGPCLFCRSKRGDPL